MSKYQMLPPDKAAELILRHARMVCMSYPDAMTRYLVQGSLFDTDMLRSEIAEAIQAARKGD